MCSVVLRDRDDGKDYFRHRHGCVPDDHPRHYFYGVVDLQIDPVRSKRLVHASARTFLPSFCQRWVAKLVSQITIDNHQ